MAEKKRKKTMELNYTTRKIDRFDILLSDPYSDNGSDECYMVMYSNVTMQYVWQWLSDSGDWSFKITEHDNRYNVFIYGDTMQSMCDAVNGLHEDQNTVA